MLSHKTANLDIRPENILLIKDVKSVFKDKVMYVGLKDKKLFTEEKEMTIENKIWDGQSLIDKSLMGDYQDKGMLLLRHKFFKSCWDINTPMDVTQMKQTSTTATIKAIQAPAVKVADYDSEVELGNAINEAAEQQAIAVGRKYDTDAIAEALKSPLKYKLGAKNTVTQDEMIAILGLYGDDRDSADFDAIVISSLFAPSFYKMDMFTSRERTMTKDGNGIAVNGVIGEFLNIPVVLSDRLIIFLHSVQP